MLNLFRATAVLVVASLSACVGNPAFAQATSSPSIDFRPLAQTALEILAPILALIGAWAVTKALAMFKINADDKVRAAIETALQKGLSLGLSKAQAYVAGAKLSVEVKNQVLADAANYAIMATPDALKRFGITPARLTEMLEARLYERPAPTSPAG